jgi:hypothetical protein
MQPNSELRPFEQMQRMLIGHFSAQCLHAAAILGLADLIEDGKTSAKELALTTKCDSDSIQRLMRTLASLGVFTQGPDDHFALTPLGATLRSNAPDSVRDMAIFIASQPMWSAWGSLSESLKTGAASFPKRNGAAIYQYLATHQDLGAVFNRFMSAQSKLHNAAIVDAYDFSGIETLVDVGGGHGATVSAVLISYPAMRGVVFDLPEVIAKAELNPAELKGRCQFAGGNMLESVPSGGDAYLIKRVLMDSTDQEVVAVLENCRAAMKPGGRLLVVDPMLPGDNVPHPNWLMDINALVVHGGACRTEAQFSDLLASAGFALSRVIATRSPNFIIEAHPH